MTQAKFDSLEVHNLEYYNDQQNLVITHKFLESAHNHCWFSPDSLKCQIQYPNLVKMTLNFTPQLVQYI